MGIFTLGSSLLMEGYLMMTYQQLRQFLKKKIMFGKFTGCKDLQEIRIYLYGFSKVNSTFYDATTCRKFFCWFNFVFYKINRSNK